MPTINATIARTNSELCDSSHVLVLNLLMKTGTTLCCANFVQLYGVSFQRSLESRIFVSKTTMDCIRDPRG